MLCISVYTHHCSPPAPLWGIAVHVYYFVTWNCGNLWNCSFKVKRSNFINKVVKLEYIFFLLVPFHRQMVYTVLVVNCYPQDVIHQ